jgi:hypothetical protein
MFEPNPGAPDRVDVSNACGKVAKGSAAGSAQKDLRQCDLLSLIRRLTTEAFVRRTNGLGSGMNIPPMSQ